MNPTSKSSLPVALDPVAAAIITQLKREMEEAIAAKDRVIALSEMKIQKLEEELRLERIKKYGLCSETLSDLQLKLLDLEPAVSSDEVQGESERGPLPKSTDKQRRSRENHPGRNELPAHLERVDKIIPCAPRAVQVRQVRWRYQGHRLRRIRNTRQ
jgi:transposase